MIEFSPQAEAIDTELATTTARPMHGKNPGGQGVQGWRFSERSGENTTRPLDGLDKQQTPEAA